MRYWLFFPILVILFLLIIFWLFLWGGDNKQGSDYILLDRKPFSFSPQSLYDSEFFYDASIFTGRVSIVNFFASWCVPCIAEHGSLASLSRDGRFQVVGLNWKDKRASAISFLEEHGNVYDIVGYDFNGRTAIDWGLRGVPETFILDGDGVIRYHYVGAILSADTLAEIFFIAGSLL